MRYGGVWRSRFSGKISLQILAFQAITGYPVPAGEHSPSSQQVLSEVTWFPQLVALIFGAYGHSAKSP